MRARLVLYAATTIALLTMSACASDNATTNEVKDMNNESTTSTSIVVEPTVGQEVIDELWLEEPFESAMVGGVMQIANDAFRLSVVASDGETAKLAILHPTDTTLERSVEVQLRSVFDVGDHQVMIGSVSETSVVASWRLVQS